MRDYDLRADPDDRPRGRSKGKAVGQERGGPAAPAFDHGPADLLVLRAGRLGRDRGSPVCSPITRASFPPSTSSQSPSDRPNIAILASDGSLLANRGDTGGAAVHLSELPPYLPKAFIAIEDRRFYDHFGIDPVGILRAGLRDVTGSGGGMQGGSTLTQQLAKNLFLTQERTFSRKIQEAISRALARAQIFQGPDSRALPQPGLLWLRAPTGVEAAAQKYFGKSARNVTLSEAALLAGLMKSPTRLAPNIT